MQIPGHVKGFIIGELRSHRGNKVELEKLLKDKKDIYHRSRQPNDEPVKGSHSGDPTYSKVVQLERVERMIAYLERRISCVEDGLRICTPEEKKLLEYRYMQEYEPTNEETADYMHYGNRNKFYWVRDAAIAKIAKPFGIYDARWERGEKY
jgi:hypothetical protein